MKIFCYELPSGKGKTPLPDALFIVEPKKIDAQQLWSVDVNPRPVDVTVAALEQDQPDGGYQHEVYQWLGICM